MGKLRLMLSILILNCANLYAYDYVQYNTDEKTIKQVMANTAVQTLNNELQNVQVDSIKSRQTKLAGLLGLISANKLLLQETYKNVSGFKRESLIYKNIVNVGTNIIAHSGEAVVAINKSKFTGKAVAIIRIGSLVTDAISLGKFFADIVSNGKVENPIKDENNSLKSDSDGPNLLNRHDRLKMANSILDKLREIDRKLINITYVCRFASADRLFREIDTETYLNMLTAKRHMNDVISSWNALKK